MPKSTVPILCRQPPYLLLCHFISFGSDKVGQRLTLPVRASRRRGRLRGIWRRLAASMRASRCRGRVRTAPRHVAATCSAGARLLLSRASLHGMLRRLALPVHASRRCGRVRTAPRHVAATGSAGARLPLSRASPNGSTACGGDWHCQCAPPVVAGESEQLRGMWRRPAAPVRASRCRGRVRTAPRHVAATVSAIVRLPLSRASPNGSAACGGD